jgi:hypothetical protein
MSAVLDAIYAARLRELAGFLALPTEQLAHALGIIGADSRKVLAAGNLMMADGEPVPMPRGWREDDALLWATLSAPIQQIVADRERSRNRELRLKQDEAAKLRHENEKLKALLAPAPEATTNNGAQGNQDGKETTERSEGRAQGGRTDLQKTEALSR